MSNFHKIIEQELRKLDFISIKLFCEYATDFEIFEFIKNVSEIHANNLLDKASDIAFEEVNNNNTSASEVEQKIFKLKK